DTSSVTDMSCMFNGCSSLTMIDVGKGWTTSSVNTGNDMFSGCTSLVGGAGTAYDAKDPALAATVTGTLGSDTVSYQLSRAAGEGVGSYAITASGKATQGNYSVTFRGATLTIKAASLSGASVSAIGEKPYTGKAIKPKVTLGGRKLELGTDYTIKYASNKKVGTATVTITGKGNYCGSKVVKFKIVKAKNPMTVKVVTKTAKLSTLKGKAVSVVPITVSKAKGDVTYTKVSKGSSKYLKVNAKTGRVTVAKGTKRGTYKIRVKVTAAGNGSYKKATKTVTCKVTVR
ncbi:MAG: MBG domain-containing protein, partial [Coriobacteriales bacterium]|nr:MBG domain-containing protein [Coriobacteriales bacterium]